MWECGGVGGRDTRGRRSGGRDRAFHDLSPAGGQQEERKGEGDQDDKGDSVFAHVWWYSQDGWDIKRTCAVALFANATSSGLLSGDTISTTRSTEPFSSITLRASRIRTGARP